MSFIVFSFQSFVTKAGRMETENVSFLLCLRGDGKLLSRFVLIKRRPENAHLSCFIRAAHLRNCEQ
jgi:hypothetical protein